MFFAISLILSLVNASTVDVRFDVSRPAPRTFNEGLLRGAIGSSHAATSLRADWQEQLLHAHKRIGVQRVRFHGIFDDDMSVVLARGQYSFLNAFKAYDFLVANGIAPIVELSFMPALFQSSNATIFHYQGGISPPRAIADWTDLVTTFSSALIQRYSLPVVSEWVFEVFNEPNCGFWTGNQTQYFEFYAATAFAVKAASPKLKVGGPVTCQLAWLDDFCSFCETNNVPVDIVTSHLYPSDPQLPANKTAFADAVNAASATARKYNLPFFLTEFNAGLDFDANHQILDTSYAAAFVGLQLGLLDGSQAGISYWCLSDVFEEQGQFPGEFGTTNPTPFGIVTVSGIAKPVFRAMELISKFVAGGKQPMWLAQVTNPAGDDALVDAWATKMANGTHSTLAVFVTSFLPLAMRTSGTTLNQTVQLTITAASAPRGVATRCLIDDNHSNPRAAWVKRGSPVYPSPADHSAIAAASVLQCSTVPSRWNPISRTLLVDLGVVSIDSFASVQIDF
jgi:xylan 1,4-beta-xylosidase